MMKKKVLIVDDNPDIRFTVKAGLESDDNNMEVIQIENGEKCIDYLRHSTPPDLILLDIMMPGLDGWTVASKIRSHPQWKHIHIFFLTAKNDPYSRSFGQLITDQFISKPFELTHLKKSINKVLG